MRYMFSKSLMVLLVFIATLTTTFAQDEKEKKSFFRIIWGDPVESSYTFMPFGTHPKRHELFGAWFNSLSYKSAEAAVFYNSKREWTVGLFYKRAWNFTKRFSINYGGGLMYGYKGKLQNTKGIPLRNTFLFTGPINPYAGFEADYKLSDKVSIHTSLNPLIVIYGLRFIL